MKKYLTWWLGTVLVIAVLINFLVPDPTEKENTLGGLAIAAVVSLFFLFKSLNSQWSGTVTEIKTEKRYEADEDGGGEVYNVDYAYIRLNNGKTKKVRSQGWKVGDKLEKVRGEANIKVLCP